MTTASEIQEMEKDILWWQEIEPITGWTLFGFTYRHSASFSTGVGSTIQLTGFERTAILEGTQRLIAKAMHEANIEWTISEYNQTYQPWDGIEYMDEAKRCIEEGI